MWWMGSIVTVTVTVAITVLRTVTVTMTEIEIGTSVIGGDGEREHSTGMRISLRGAGSLRDRILYGNGWASGAEIVRRGLLDHIMDHT